MLSLPLGIPRPVRIVLWCVLVPLLAIGGYLITGALLMVATGSNSVVAMTLLGVLFAAAVLAVRRLRPRWFEIRESTTPLTESITRSALLVVGATLAAFLAGQTVSLSLYLIVGSEGFEDFAEVQQEHAVVWVLLLTLLAAPLGEEALFRGLIFPLLRRKVSLWVAVGVQAAAFTLVHGNLVQIAASLPLALLLAVLYERTRSLWLCIGVHLGFNLLATFTPIELIAPLVNIPFAIALLTISLWAVVRIGRPGKAEAAFATA